jgi:hypothetical protein
VSSDNEEVGKEILRKMNRILRTSASCLIVVLFAGLSYAQQAACKISPLRGATSPAGAEGAMFVINNGRPCRYSVYEHPAQRRNPGARGEIALPPKHGTVELSPPRFQYTPVPGYSGEDVFSVQMWTGGTNVVLLKFNLKVTVQPPD